jgi:histidyl-tRNA synthetase
MERLILLLDEKTGREKEAGRLFVACMGWEAQKTGFQLLQELRLGNLFAEMDYESRSLKAQMRRADKLGVSHVLILGEDELAKGVALLRNMATGTQEEIPLQGIVEQILRRVKKPDPPM